jgi:hypothetical protein
VITTSFKSNVGLLSTISDIKPIESPIEILSIKVVLD